MLPVPVGREIMEERLQKIISDYGITSRRKAEELIRAGKVRVNGELAILGMKADPERDTIECEGKILKRRSDKVYIMLNKPRGYVTTMSDEKGRHIVTELVSDVKERIYPVGRLDMNSEGLLILTNDGAAANKLMHPSQEIEKCYVVKVRGSNLDEGIEHLREPMEIDGYTIQPAGVKIIGVQEKNATLFITIHEGRNRQIRKMCEQSGLDVVRLKRVSEGELNLGKLRSGTWRYLSQDEIDYIINL